MFKSSRYLTRGVNTAIPLELQLFLWECVDRLPDPKDRFQIFDLKPIGEFQSITHRSEEPEYHMEYLIPSENPLTAKVYLIDDGDHSTMLLADEY